MNVLDFVPAKTLETGHPLCRPSHHLLSAVVVAYANVFIFSIMLCLSWVDILAMDGLSIHIYFNIFPFMAFGATALRILRCRILGVDPMNLAQQWIRRTLGLNR